MLVRVIQRSFCVMPISLRSLLLLAPLLCAAQAQAQAPAQELAPCAADAYTGKELRSHNGSAADLSWYRRVRAEPTAQGCLRYVLRAAPRAGVFDSIAPVPLGGAAMGFEAVRDGQRRLFSPHGQDLLGESYSQPLRIALPALPASAWQNGRYAGQGQPPAALTLALGDARRGTVFMRVQQGRVVARSAWLAAPAESGLARSHPVPAASGLQPVANMQGAVGLLALATLRETVPMRYAAVGALPESGQPQKIWLLLAQRPAGSGEEESGEKSSEESGLIEFFLPDGRPITTLPAAQDVHDARTQDGQRRYLALQDRTGGTCHYLSPTLQPLLAGGVPAAADKPCPALREGQPLRFTDAAGRTLRYSYTPQNGLTPLGEPLPGALVAQNANHFMLRLDASSKDEAANSPRYMAYDDSGTPMPDAVGFDGFEDQGCGAWRVLRDGQWRFFTEGGLLPDREAPVAGCSAGR